jgi:hypothetical protein
MPQPLLLTVVTYVQAPMDIYLIANDPVGVLLFLSPMLGCLFNIAFFSVVEGLLWTVVMEGFLWTIVMESFLWTVVIEGFVV